MKKWKKNIKWTKNVDNKKSLIYNKKKWQIKIFYTFQQANIRLTFTMRILPKKGKMKIWGKKQKKK